MLNRHFLRVKVLQALYAFKIDDSSDIDNQKKNLLNGFYSLLDLEAYMLSAALYLHSLYVENLDDNKQKMLPTEQDINPNMKFANNEFIELLKNDASLQERIKKLKINWNEEKDFFKKILKKFLVSDVLKAYIELDEDKFNAHRNIIVKLFKNYLIANEGLFDIICDKNLLWESDYELVSLYLIKQLKNYDGSREIIADLDLDLDYIESLYFNTIKNDSEFSDIIKDRINNWDLDRVALIDEILVKMGLTEFLYCPNIPINVTLNEYIELAKEYSTQKSKLFINGILDKLMVDLRAKGKINKIEESNINTEELDS